jgi:predicted dithiol-disulfide oxidoreductase (DUF899 family)
MKNDGIAIVKNHKVASHEEWLSARKALLAKEKELTHLRDEVSEQRRFLPWEAVTKEYVFEGPNGKESLGQLFDGRSQLVVYHAMFHPAKASARTPWTGDAACEMCSFWIDNFNGIVTHLNHRDVTMVAASRAPYEKLEAYRKRMGWTFKWVSTGDGGFNFDYRVSLTDQEMAQPKVDDNYGPSGMKISELPGISVFYKDPGGRVFHTYSTYARGLDMLNVAYHYLDLVPKGRDEGEGGNGTRWVHRHDEYPAT